MDDSIYNVINDCGHRILWLSYIGYMYIYAIKEYAKADCAFYLYLNLNAYANN